VQDRAAPNSVANNAEQLLLIARPATGIAVLTLNRPAARNSLSLDMLEALHQAIVLLSDDQTVRAAVIAANGPAFCAGHDLKELTNARSGPDRGLAFFKLTMEKCASTMQAIMASPKPFIAAVEGPASAAGCQLVATCDLAVASETAKFATPGVNIGLFCSTPMVALTRNVSRKHAMEMLLLGEMLSAADAKEHGLINRVVPQGAALDGAIAMAATIASKSPLTVAVGKAAFYRQLEQPVAEAYTFAASVMVENMMASDAAEGIGAFIDKRDPTWTGR
jgi:enoyl-CoA hydratase/carnithine racemase